MYVVAIQHVKFTEKEEVIGGGDEKKLKRLFFGEVLAMYIIEPQFNKSS